TCTKIFPLEKQQGAERGVAKAVRFFKDYVEHRGQVTRRAVDDLQHLGRRGLLLQSLARLSQQPCILHRDDRLCGEGFKQCDLFVGKRVRLTTVDKNRPKQGAVVVERHAQCRAHTASVDNFARYSGAAVNIGISRIRDLDDAFSLHHPVKDAAGRRSHWSLLEQPLDEFRVPPGCDRTTEITLDPKDVAIRCAAQTQRLLQNRIEYRGELTGGAVDNLQYFGGRGLPLQPRITFGCALGQLTL